MDHYRTASHSHADVVRWVHGLANTRVAQGDRVFFVRLEHVEATSAYVHKKGADLQNIREGERDGDRHVEREGCCEAAVEYVE